MLKVLLAVGKSLPFPQVQYGDYKDFRKQRAHTIGVALANAVLTHRRGKMLCVLPVQFTPLCSRTVLLFCLQSSVHLHCSTPLLIKWINVTLGHFNKVAKKNKVWCVLVLLERTFGVNKPRNPLMLYSLLFLSLY